MLLPHQEPLGIFIHQNPLSGLEHLPFDAAVERASEVLGAKVRLDESEYRQLLDRGLIDIGLLRTAFEQETGDDRPLCGEVGSRRDASWSLLTRGLATEHWRVRAFWVAEGRPDPLVARFDDRVQATLAEGARRLFSRDLNAAVAVLTGTGDPMLHAERLREQQGLPNARTAMRRCMTEDRKAAELGFGMLFGQARLGIEPHGRRVGPDVDVDAVHRHVDDVVLPVVGAFLDRGAADLAPAAPTMFGLGVAALRRRGLFEAVGAVVRPGPLDTMVAVFDEVGVDDREIALERVLYARPGWAGAVRVAEHHRRCSLEEYAALRLVATLAVCRDRGIAPATVLTRPMARRGGMGTRASRAAQVLAAAGVGPDRAAGLGRDDWTQVERLIDDCGPAWRARLLHEARESTAAAAWLTAIAAASAKPPRRPAAPRFQVLCCLDDREESFRRILEEVGGDDVETFGLAGHFGLTIRYRGATDVHATTRHPVLLASTHAVEEHGQPRPLRQWAGRATGLLGRRTAGLVAGAAATVVAGFPALLATWLRVVWPLGSGRRAAAVAQRLDPVSVELQARLHSGHGAAAAQRLDPVNVELQARLDTGHGAAAAQRLDPVNAELQARHDRDSTDALPRGFTAVEGAARVGAVLRSIGLTRGFAPWVAAMGHGSTSLNNPHASAYDCGACGGSRGDANARIFAQLANDPEVRDALRADGIDIPEATQFVGAYHDTASDEVRFHTPPDDALVRLCRRARAQHAMERGRRFALLAPDAGSTPSLRHVQTRSANPSEPRPECGHATNALLVVGERSLLRGLFLDRRAFLHSYDPATDTDGAVLQAILGAALPVCAGINLEYYFSRVDNAVFGAGTKIPHNVVGLHGVCDGSMGDLRVGLPIQMVELHEPTRLLVVVLAPPQRVAEVLGRLPGIQQLVTNRWVHLAAVEAGQTWVWRDGRFVAGPADARPLLTVARSEDWYRGRVGDLAPAWVGPS